MKKQCPECGYENDEEDTECLVCGRSFESIIEKEYIEHAHQMENVSQEHDLQETQMELERKDNNITSNLENECPNCKFQNDSDSLDCLKCGIIFSKFNSKIIENEEKDGESAFEEGPLNQKQVSPSALFLYPLAILTEHKIPAIIMGVLTVVLLIFIFWPSKPIEIKITQPKMYNVFYDIPHPPNYKGMPVKFKAKLSLHGQRQSGKIKWKSDKDGHLGDGEEVSAVLSLGKHKIFVEYSDEGILATSAIIIEVLETPKWLFVKKDMEDPGRIREVKDQDGRTLIADLDNDTVVDISTGLMWMRRPVPYTFTYREALEYAKNSKFAGYNNWRLPTYKEMVDISNIYYDGRAAMLNDVFTTRHGKFWSSCVCLSDNTNSYICAYTVEYSPRLSRGYRYLAEKGIADINSKLWIRLVRNAI